MSKIYCDVFVKDGERYVKLADHRAVCADYEESAQQRIKNSDIYKKNVETWKGLAEAQQTNYKSLDVKYNELLKKYKDLKAQWDALEDVSEEESEDESEDEESVEVKPLDATD
jgi:uncharacterized protein related to proFAR isomerase